jgi:GMP synthase-like glutamine amidotransferase
MRVLSLVHGPTVRAELFGDVVRDEGHELVEVHAEAGLPALDGADALLVFGGSQHVDQEEEHPWLVPEDAFLREALTRGVPTLGVCLGAQLVAKAAGAWAGPSEHPEAGWTPVELTEAGAADPVLGALPRRFDAFQLHEYTYAVPDGAVELARSATNTQAFRLGAAWAVQFHPEVRQTQVEGWLVEADLPGREEIAASLPARLPAWQELGARLCRAFLAEARA